MNRTVRVGLEVAGTAHSGLRLIEKYLEGRGVERRPPPADARGDGGDGASDDTPAQRIPIRQVVHRTEV